MNGQLIILQSADSTVLRIDPFLDVSAIKLQLFIMLLALYAVINVDILVGSAIPGEVAVHASYYGIVPQIAVICECIDCVAQR